MIPKILNEDLLKILTKGPESQSKISPDETPLVWYKLGLIQTADGYYIPVPHYFVLIHGTSSGPLLLGLYTGPELQDPELSAGYYFCHPAYEPWDPNTVLPVPGLAWNTEINQKILEYMTYKSLQMVSGKHKRYHLVRYNCKHFVEDIVKNAINDPSYQLPGSQQPEADRHGSQPTEDY
jgi:hypothetical protein